MTASSTVAVLLALATVGAGDDVAKVGSLTGFVVRPDGRPARGAEVLASGGAWDGDPPTLLGRTRTDDGGRFVLELSRKPAGCDRPVVWAILEGSVVASCPIDHQAIEGKWLRLVLGSPCQSSFVVVGPGGRPIAGARVIPSTVAREVADLPEALGALTSATTDPQGRAVVTGFRPEELVGVRVVAAGFGVQPREFRSQEGLAEVGAKSITIVASGRISGRVVADDPKSVGDLTVIVSSTTGGQGGSKTGLAEVKTDASGKFEVEAVASGSVTVRVRPRDGSPNLPTRVIHRNLESGGTLEVEIPLRRGVRVTGVALDADDGEPVPGAMISVVPLNSSGPFRVMTDDLGRYETYVSSGLVSHRVLKVPFPYLCPPSFLGPRAVEVPPAIARFELPVIRLKRGREIRGMVIDAKGHPVSGGIVEGSWTLFDGRNRATRSEMVTSRSDGSFVLGPVAPDAEVSVVATFGEASTSIPRIVRTVDANAIELKVIEPDVPGVTGRVISADGRAIPNASVRIWSMEDRKLLRFGDSDELTANTEGKFQLPVALRRDRDYRVFGSAQGYLPDRTRSIRFGPVDPPIFPSVVLTVESPRVVVEGLIVDQQGRPVADVGVRTSESVSFRRRATTDGGGKFRLEDVPEGPHFLFVEGEGFRFAGRAIEAGRGPVEMTLTRLSEEPSTSMVTQIPEGSGMALARRVVAPYADKVLGAGDHSTKLRTLELLARVDPKRVLDLINSQGVEDLWFADQLRHTASCSSENASQDARLAIVQAIRDAEWRVLGGLDAADAVPETAKALKREWVERALLDAQSIPEPSRRVVSLAKVAEHLILMGENARASRLLEEARPIAESLAPGGSGGRARMEFAETLALSDPANALALTENVVDPGSFDQCRLKIARKLAKNDPIRALRIIESLRDPRSLTAALPALCHSLAKVDPVIARQLLTKVRGDEPCLPAYALGMMALAIADRDKPVATAWLREAFDKLDQIASSIMCHPDASHDPAAVAAALLPVAEKINPRLVPELFWRAVSLHRSRPGSGVRSDAVLALLLARYDRSVARSFFEPLAERAIASGEADLGALIAASAILDPIRAVRLIEELPEAPDLTFHHPKNEARLTLAAALARSAPACWNHATTRFLKLWIDGMPEGD